MQTDHILVFDPWMLFSDSYYCPLLGHTCFRCNRTIFSGINLCQYFTGLKNVTGLHGLASVNFVYFFASKFWVQLIK